MQPEQLKAFRHITASTDSVLGVKQTVPQGPRFITLRQFSGKELNILILLNDRYPEIYTSDLLLGLMNRRPGKQQEFTDTVYDHIDSVKQGTKLSIVYNAVDRLAHAGFLPDDVAEKIEEKIRLMKLVERKMIRR